MKDSGDVTAVRYHPYEGVTTMSEFLRREYDKRMALPKGDVMELLGNVTDKLREARMKEFY